MAEGKNCAHTGPCLCPFPGNGKGPRLFTDKEMQGKAARWKAEMDRANNGGRKAHDTIPGDLDAAKALARKFFYPTDAATLIGELDRLCQAGPGTD
jgi:hypothetical protein